LVPYPQPWWVTTTPPDVDSSTTPTSATTPAPRRLGVRAPQARAGGPTDRPLSLFPGARSPLPLRLA
jgi:hypothetical protein